MHKNQAVILSNSWSTHGDANPRKYLADAISEIFREKGSLPAEYAPPVQYMNGVFQFKRERP